MNDYVITTRNEDGVYFYVSADRYEVIGKFTKTFYFFYHDKVICSIDVFRVFKIERFDNDNLIVEYQDK